MKTLPIEHKVILLLCKTNHTHDEINEIEKLIDKLNWKKFLKITDNQSITPLIYKNLLKLKNKNSIPENIITSLKNRYLKVLSKNIILYEHLKIIINEFNNKNIPVIALKGIYYAEHLYNEIAIRQIGDIDLLIKEKDIEKVITTLLSLGYTATKFLTLSESFNKEIKHRHLSPFVKNGVSVEIHTKIADSDTVNLSVEELWERAINVTINSTKCLALSVNDNIMHLCLHIFEHINGCSTIIILLHSFTDLYEFINKNKENIRWDNLIANCKKYNCLKEIINILYLSDKYFKSQLPENILSENKNLIENKFEEYFLMHLTNDKKIAVIFNSQFTENLISNNLKIKNKYLFLFKTVFPSINFMKERYKTNNPFIVLYYYLVRIYNALKVTVYFLLKKLRLIRNYE
jgi:hypothetical protein